MGQKGSGVEKSGEQFGEEGCLSIGKVYAPLSRAERVLLRAQDVKGKFFEQNGVISRTKMKALIAAMAQLGDLPTDTDIGTLVMPGTSTLGD